MEVYIGMGVSAASCTLAVIFEKGRKLKGSPVEINGQALDEVCRRADPAQPFAWRTRTSTLA